MIYAAILAGGKGTRMGNTELPKQFIKIGNKPIIIHTIEKFLLSSKIDYILVVVPSTWINLTQDLINKHISNNRNNIVIIEGGSTRNETLMKGVEYINNTYEVNDDDIIITHDAVRPFISYRIIEDNIKMAEKYGATDTVIKATDTIVQSIDNDIIDSIPIREYMYQGQTPQSFNIKLLMEKYDELSDKEKDILTDAAKIMVLKGVKVKLVEGEQYNIKITTQYDLLLADTILKGNVGNDK